MTFYELEKKCKRKRLFKFLFIVVLLIIVSLILVYFFFKDKNTSYQKPIKKVKIVLSKKEENNKTKQITIKKTFKKTLPEVNFTKEINITKEKNISIVKETKEKNISKTEKNISKVEKNISKIVEKNLTNIKPQKIILNSITLPSFNTCISIAKKYLKQKDYQDALKWAKYANIQNKDNPKSWIISAKALYYMGKKEEALKLLKIYNSYYNNKEIERLIKEFESE